MKVAFHTLGCRLNQSESAVLAKSFEEAGYKKTDEAAEADVCVLNTCTVTNVSDSKCRNWVRRLVRSNPDAKIAVIGCYAESGFKAIQEIGGVDIVIGNQEKLNLLKYLPEKKQSKATIIRDRIQKEDFTIDTIGQSDEKARASLKIQDGCDFICSFCIIPQVRGRAKSRVFHNLLEEAKGLVELGYKELVLTGVNVGTYNNESYTFLNVLDALNDLDLPRVRISSIEPTTVAKGILERMADENHNLVPYLHLPLQSGSDSVLEEMRRKYSIKEYYDFIHHANSIVPNITIGTDVILGTPSEKEEHFDETYAFIKNNPIDYAHAFTYSERTGTTDINKDQIPMQIRKNRTRMIVELSKEKKMAKLGQYLGCTLSVLFEENSEGFWSGHSENFLLLKVKSSDNLLNKIYNVKLIEICGDWGLCELLNNKEKK
jgi:threonylcarbamoyladenosine tRNA methylthiotransferase MtaB